ncbi:MAG: hypothetical protein ACRDQU_02020 [Pseudonocardiaceae bacterium]
MVLAELGTEKEQQQQGIGLSRGALLDEVGVNAAKLRLSKIVS